MNLFACLFNDSSSFLYLDIYIFIHLFLYLSSNFSRFLFYSPSISQSPYIYQSLCLHPFFHCYATLIFFQLSPTKPRAPSPPPLRAFRQPLSTSAQPPIGLGLRSAVLLSGSSGPIDAGSNLGPGITAAQAVTGPGIAGSRVGMGLNSIGLRQATRLGLGSGGIFDIHIAVLPPSRRYATSATLFELSR